MYNLHDACKGTYKSSSLDWTRLEWTAIHKIMMLLDAVSQCARAGNLPKIFSLSEVHFSNRRLLSSNRMPSSIAEQLVESMWPSQILQALMHCTHLEFPKLWDVVAEA